MSSSPQRNTHLLRLIRVWVAADSADRQAMCQRLRRTMRLRRMRGQPGFSADHFMWLLAKAGSDAIADLVARWATKETPAGDEVGPDGPSPGPEPIPEPSWVKGSSVSDPSVYFYFKSDEIGEKVEAHVKAGRVKLENMPLGWKPRTTAERKRVHY